MCIYFLIYLYFGPKNIILSFVSLFFHYLKKHHNLIFSEVIRKWAEPPRRRIGPFTTSKMEDTYIRDLTIRLGYPYVYVHQVAILIAIVFAYLTF